MTRLGGDVEKYRPEEDLRSVRRMVDLRLPSVNICLIVTGVQFACGQKGKIWTTGLTR